MTSEQICAAETIAGTDLHITTHCIAARNHLGCSAYIQSAASADFRLLKNAVSQPMHRVNGVQT